MDAQRVAQVVADAGQYRWQSSRSVANILSGLVGHGEIVDAYIDSQPGDHRVSEKAFLAPDPIPLVLVTSDGTHINIWLNESWESKVIKESQPATA